MCSRVKDWNETATYPDDELSDELNLFLLISRCYYLVLILINEIPVIALAVLKIAWAVTKQKHLLKLQAIS